MEWLNHTKASIEYFSLSNSSVENGQLTDPAHWAVADVVNYFKATGFEEQANAFHDQVGVHFVFLHKSTLSTVYITI